jgi:hypothetical protein
VNFFLLLYILSNRQIFFFFSNVLPNRILSKLIIIPYKQKLIHLTLPHTLSLKETKTKKETNAKPSSSLFSLSLSLSLGVPVTHSSFSTSEGPVDKLYYTDPHATIFVPWVLNNPITVSHCNFFLV